MIDTIYLAGIAKLILTRKEAVNLQKGFQKTLETIEFLKHLIKPGLKPTSQVTGLTNVFREDKIDHSRSLTQKQALSAAKNTYQGYFVVKAILYET